MVELNKQYREQIKTIISRRAPGSKIFIFGSRASGKSRKSSDLDLAIQGGNCQSLRTMMIIKEDFENSTLPFHVDVVDWHKLKPKFKEIIQSRGIINIDPSETST